MSSSPLSFATPSWGRHDAIHPIFSLATRRVSPPNCIEVKYAEDLRANQAQFAQRFLAARQYAEAEGWEFSIWTEVEIKTTYLKNAKFLLRFRSPAIVVRPEYQRLLLELVAQLGRTTPAEVLLAVFESPEKQAELLPVLWYLMSTAQLGCNLSEQLTMHSSLWSILNPPALRHG